MVIPQKAAERIYKAAARTDRRDFRIEDMLYTGVLREKAKVTKIMESPPGIICFDTFVHDRQPLPQKGFKMCV